MLAPLALDDGGGDQRSIRFAGHGRDDNNYMMDGVDATGIQEQAQKSTTRLQVSEDAIQEYRVSTALYDAQYGAGNGGQVDIVTKTGAWFTFGETRLGQGREAAKDFLNTNKDVADEIERRIRGKINEVSLPVEGIEEAE